MTSCPKCALPSSAPTGTCAFCQTALLAGAPILVRLLRESDNADVFTLASGDAVMASAHRDGNLWQIETGGETSFKLVSVRDEAGREIVLFDGMLNVVSTLRVLDQSFAPAAILFDAAERLTAVVRADGCGGLHMMAPDGNVLLFAGRSRNQAGSLDLLLTDVGASFPLVALFAAMVGLETEGVGPLHPRGLVLDGDSGE